MKQYGADAVKNCLIVDNKNLLQRIRKISWGYGGND